MASRNPTSRLPSVDILRSIAILSMIQIHFIEYLAGYRPWPDWLPYAVCGVPGILAAPIFAFLLGLSLHISIERQRGRGRPERAIAARTLKRSILVFAGGLLYAFLIWGPSSVLDWDILTFLGAAIALLFLLRERSPAILLLLVTFIAIVSPPLRRVTHYAFDWRTYWGLAEYEPHLTFLDALKGFVANGYFPLFPWLVFPVAGFTVGKLFPPMGAQSKKEIPLGWLAGAGAALIGLGFVGQWLAPKVALSSPWRGYVSGFSFYPLSTTQLSASLGVVVLMFTLLRLTVDRLGRTPALSRFFERYSRASLAIYVIHHVVHVWPLRLAGWLAHGDEWYYYGDVVSPVGALLLAMVFVVASYPLLGVWSRFASLIRDGDRIKNRPSRHETHC